MNPRQSSSGGVPAREWTDDDGEPLGMWVEVSREEWRAILALAGGTMGLTVFSTLTDPDGIYGEPQIYTAWGRREDDVPLVDVRDYKDPERSVYRKFVRTSEETREPDPTDAIREATRVSVPGPVM